MPDIRFRDLPTTSAPLVILHNSRVVLIQSQRLHDAALTPTERGADASPGQQSRFIDSQAKLLQLVDLKLEAISRSCRGIDKDYMSDARGIGLADKLEPLNDC